jgi:hypothetical protein
VGSAIDHYPENQKSMVFDTMTMQRKLAQLIFPHRTVVFTELNETCQDPNGAPIDYDMLFFVGWGFDQKYLRAVWDAREARDAREPGPEKPSVDGSWDLLRYRNSSLTPKHTKGRPITIGINNEWWAAKNNQFDIMMDTTWDGHEDGINLYWPIMSKWFAPGMGPDCFTSSTPDDLVQKTSPAAAKAALQTKTEFTAFMVSSCDDNAYLGGSNTLRVSLFDVLSETYKTPTPLSLCRAPMTQDPLQAKRNRTLRSDRFSDNFLESVIMRYKPYKFVITFDNHIGDGLLGWATERIVTAVLAGSVPIYGGTKKQKELLSRFINMDRIIWCDFESANELPKLDYQGLFPQYDENDHEKRLRFVRAIPQVESDLQACAAKVKHVDESDELYTRIVSQPFLPNNTVSGSLWDLHRIADNLRHAICVDLESPLC